MDKLILNGTTKTPKVVLDPNGTFLLEGRSIPEHPVQFYEPLYHWLDEYKHSGASKTMLDVKLEYFNTSSSKCLFDFFRRLEDIKASGSEVVVNWYYESDDDDMRETGLDYDEIVDVPFEMKEEEEIY